MNQEKEESKAGERGWRDPAKEVLGARRGRQHREGVGGQERRQTEKDEMAKSSGRGGRKIHKGLPGKRSRKSKKPWGESGGKQMGREGHQIGSPALSWNLGTPIPKLSWLLT